MPSPNCRRFHNLFAEFFIRYLQFEEGRRRALGAKGQVRQNECGAVNESQLSQLCHVCSEQRKNYQSAS
jgi:hypothetical protein